MTRPEDDLAAGDAADDAASDIEAPTEDAAEQSMPARPAEAPAEVSQRLEVGEWDAVEQSIVIDLDDDYDH